MNSKSRISKIPSACTSFCKFPLTKFWHSGQTPSPKNCTDTLPFDDDAIAEETAVIATKTLEIVVRIFPFHEYLLL